MFQNRVASMVNLHRTLSALPEYPGEPSSLKSRASSLVKLRRMFAGSEQDGTTVSPPGKLEYPIFFELPRDLPPSHHSLASFIIWRLTAHVKRKGALASDLVSGAVVTVVGSEGAPPNIPISLHGHWNDALHYSIISSSSVVSLGAEWPVEITLRPISKVKIREITAELQGTFSFLLLDVMIAQSAILQERVVYYTKGRVVLHKLAPVGHTLLTIRRTGLPILPVMSDDIKAFRTSSLFPYVETEEPQTSSLLGPGPWTLRCNLDMSHKVKHLHRTHTNAMSNVSVTHVLRIVIKVQEGGSTADIVKEAPVHILSVRRFLTTERRGVDSGLSFSLAIPTRGTSYRATCRHPPRLHRPRLGGLHHKPRRLLILRLSVPRHLLYPRRKPVLYSSGGNNTSASSLEGSIHAANVLRRIAQPTKEHCLELQVEADEAPMKLVVAQLHGTRRDHRYGSWTTYPRSSLDHGPSTS